MSGTHIHTEISQIPVFKDISCSPAIQVSPLMLLGQKNKNKEEFNAY